MTDSMTPKEEVLSIERIATMCGTDSARIGQMMDLGLLSADGLDCRDVNGIRLLLSFERSGIALSTLATAVERGVISLDFSRHLMPDTIILTDRTYGEASAELGLDFDTASRFFVAVGFPAPDPERRIRADGIAFLQLMATTLARGVSEQAAERILRVFGQSTRRIAEAMRDFFRSEVELPLEQRGLSPAEVMTAAAEHRVPLQQLGFQALRLLSARFLEDVVFENLTARIQDALIANGLLEPGGVGDPAVAFVDVADYSALTRQLGDREAASTVARFEAIAQETMVASGGRIVKSLGDGLLLLFRSPARAPESCVDLIDRLARAGLPEVRVGITVGPVIRRDGDIFGNSVNLAARLSALAAPSGIVADAASVALIENPSVRWRPAGSATPKGMPETEIFTLEFERPALSA